jgi:hypothetical protein
MKLRRTGSIILPMFVVVGMLAGGTGRVLAASTLVVDDDGMAVDGNCDDSTPTYSTIVDAVGAASSGDTIKVCAGTYNGRVTIGMALTLEGPNFGVDPNPAGSRVAEATIDAGADTAVVPAADDIVIDGFTIHTSDAGFPIYTGGSSVNDLTIANNIIESGVRALTVDTNGDNISILHNQLNGDGYDVHFGAGTYNDLKINGNVLTGPVTYYSIFINGSGTVDGFEFENNEVYDAANIAANISNGTVSGNTFDVPAASGLAIQIDLHGSSITDNDFTGNGAACLQIYGSQFGLVPSSNVEISANSFDGCGSPGPYYNYAIQLSQGVTAINIHDNAITDSYDGINTRTGSPWAVDPATAVHYNNITGSTRYGVNNTTTGTLNATCNWWGAANGPGPVGTGSGDRVSKKVTFIMWLIAEAPGGACTGTPTKRGHP